MCSRIRLGMALLMALGLPPAKGFSLLGPFAEWQVEEIGYQLGGDIGGAMSLGEEYRLNLPIITYGFESSFLNHFGQRGVEQVEEAIAILEALPSFSAMSQDLSEFPLDTRRFNFQANALNILDLKSYALGILLELLGLNSPERYTFTLRSRVVINEIPFYTTIMRNYDPVTLNPSAYVNGTLFAYSIAQTRVDPDVFESIPIAVDPLAPVGTTVAFLGAWGGAFDPRGIATLEPGMFFTGLTRDDVGGLRYVYRRNNFNVEELDENSIPFGGAGGAWSPIGAGATNELVATALRPGVDRLRFQRVDFDSMVGQLGTNVVVNYQDSYVTNNVIRQQGVQRVLVQPDITFSAPDAGVDAVGLPFTHIREVEFIDNNEINRPPGTPGLLLGPGQMGTPLVIGFNRIGRWFRNVQQTPQEQGTVGFVWGSFDGTTNAPIVYPLGTSILELEQAVLRGDRGEAWRPVPFPDQGLQLDPGFGFPGQDDFGP